MVSEAKGRLFRRKDGKYILYIPVDLAEDSMFPFQEFKPTKRGTDMVLVKLRFEKLAKEQLLRVEPWKDAPEKVSRPS